MRDRDEMLRTVEAVVNPQKDMDQIDLKYGHSRIPFKYEENCFDVLGTTIESKTLSDAEIGQKLDSPIDSSQLEEIVNPGESVLIVVPDATRQTACGQIVNLVVRRLIANGTAPFEISIIFATGIHRKVTEAEKSSILTPFIAQRIKTFHHDPRDLMQIIRFVETSGGIPIELNRALTEHDHIILIGGVSFLHVTTQFDSVPSGLVVSPHTDENYVAAPTVGAEVPIVLSRHLSVVPELRIHAFTLGKDQRGGFAIRPGVAVRWSF